jgi:hypothetical protein
MFVAIGIVIATVFGILFFAPSWLSQPASTHPFSFAIYSAGPGDVGVAIFDPPKGSYVSGNESFSGPGPYDTWLNDSQGTLTSGSGVGGGMGTFSFPATDPPYTFSFKSLGGPETYYISGTYST